MQRNIIIRIIDQNVNACVESRELTISYFEEDDKVSKKLHVFYFY